MSTSHASSARSGDTGDVWEKAARAGYAVSGLIHIMLGVIIVQIPLAGGGGTEADSSSALSQIAESAFGGFALWGAAAAFVALAAWQAADAFRGSDKGDRAKAAGKAVLYLSLAFTSATIAMGSGGGGSQDSQAQGFAATLMGAPGGRFLVGALGLGILAGAGYHVYKGWTQKFREELRTPSGDEVSKGVTATGTVGYIAKGVALAVVGVLFVFAAINADADEAQGLDGAIESLLGLPFGAWLVALVGIGFAAYGLYSFARARYARM
ncbi:DUF1206 domain-containing protein [Demequina sp. SO4-18]|uniref:DUF1206 domain-containing protein n=1 Tax=Demequina sp. SO4-18 TaxID=3401026 RepID=UPI003B594DE2